MIRGWCPGVHAPMPSGDGLLVRVKPPGGRLPANALRALAAATAQHGNGTVELTSRGNLQIRGLTPASAPAFAACMVAAGLADPDPAREGRRNVIAVPPCDDALVAEMEALLAGTPGLAPKFCIAVGPADADLVVLDGMLWVQGEAHPFTLDAVRQHAARAAGRRLGPARPPFAATATGLLLGLPFGQTDATALARLAELTDAARTTPWRALHVPAADPAPYAAAGFITDPADPRRSIAACPGAPACTSGTTPTRADAARLAALGFAGLHVSGCAKGCARNRPGPTLVGRQGVYDVILDGRAGDPPALRGVGLDAAAGYLAAMGLQ